MKKARQKYLEGFISKNIIKCLNELESNVEQGLFTAWSIGNNEFQVSCFWADEFKPSEVKSADGLSPSIHPTFDLASLTKPIFINLYLRYLLKNDFATLIHKPIKDLIKFEQCDIGNKDFYDFFNEPKNLHFTLDTFLSHRSGAKNWHWMGSSLWLQKATSHHKNANIYYSTLDIKDPLFQENVLANLNKKAINDLNDQNFSLTIYSDINYYILARIIEMIDDKNETWEKRLFFLNNYLDTAFSHASINSSYLKNCVPYFPYISSYNSELATHQFKSFNYGSVHDSNANILSALGEKSNIVSGHAGLFGSISDVAKAVSALSRSQYLLQNSSAKEKNRFIAGLDTPETKKTSAGIKNWPIQFGDVFGHLGYTGTSFWFYNQLNKKVSENYHILLTNRTSERKKMGVLKCPRILIVSEIKRNTTQYFQIIDKEISLIPFSEVNDLCQELSEYSHRIWDTSVLRSYPDMAKIRKSVAHKLWDI
ncbi:serine hydrolase [Fluviispira vulneris]|uniref:serine hydrolase n=1 Tax=Fluviispira vulneris TaxID=2763012 RepID=UPI00164616BD|nr:serine hydrolase [Fluviispira vulneris]